MNSEIDNLPSCSSATFSVKPSSVALSLFPLELMANMVIFKPRPEFNPETWKLQIVLVLSFIVSYQDVVQLGGSSAGLCWVDRAKVRAGKSILFTEGSS